MSPPVVLLHGLARTARSLAPVARDARAAGRRAIAIDYPSRRAPLAELAAQVVRRLDLELGGEPFDAVTHSMGGIVLRTAVANGLLDRARIHRVVMLGPPNQGSELAELLRRYRLFRVSMGPAAIGLGTATGSDVMALPPVTFTVGIVAGARSLNPFGRWIFGAPNDGKISVARTAVPGMTDFVVVQCPHMLLPLCPGARRAALAFLEHGHFGPVPPRPSL